MDFQTGPSNWLRGFQSTRATCALARDQAEGVTTAADAVCRIIDKVVVTPAAAGMAPELAIEGHLTALVTAPQRKIATGSGGGI